MSFFHLKVIVIIFSHFHIFQCSWSYFTRAELNLLFCEYIKIFKNSFFREDCICGIVILLQAHKVSCTRVDILLCLKRIYMASCTSHIFVRKWVMILYLYESNSPFCFFGAFITISRKIMILSQCFVYRITAKFAASSNPQLTPMCGHDTAFSSQVKRTKCYEFPAVKITMSWFIPNTKIHANTQSRKKKNHSYIIADYLKFETFFKCKKSSVPELDLGGRLRVTEPFHLLIY